MFSPLYLDETHKNNIQLLNLTSCSAVWSLECKVHNFNIIALLIFNIQTQYHSHTDSMSVNTWINVAFKDGSQKYVEYAAVCGFGSKKKQHFLGAFFVEYLESAGLWI